MELTKFLINNNKEKRTGQNNTKQTLYMQDKSRENNSNKARDSQWKNGVKTQEIQ